MRGAGPLQVFQMAAPKLGRGSGWHRRVVSSQVQWRQTTRPVRWLCGCHPALQRTGQPAAAAPSPAEVTAPSSTWVVPPGALSAEYRTAALVRAWARVSVRSRARVPALALVLVGVSEGMWAWAEMWGWA